jgi:nucleoside-diphosphate-sugar epimerase
MRVVVTGGAGFLGRTLVREILARGDDVVALVRDPARASHLEGERVTLVRSDLSSQVELGTAIRGADALIHAAGSYRVGIDRSERSAMWDANVGTTERALEAAATAGVPRIVYVSTVNAFGNTKGGVVDETYRRDLTNGFLSVYDETKFRAHEAAEAAIGRGAPVVIVQPSQIYGPHDHSAASAQLTDAFHGRLAYTAFPDCGLGWVHVDDLAVGILSALDRGRVGEAYVLGGPNHRTGEAVAIAARAGGQRPPRFTAPTALFRLLAPINDRVVRLPGSPANLAEVIRSAAGVTYWATAAKAGRELGFHPRSLDQGVRDTFGGGST